MALGKLHTLLLIAILVSQVEVCFISVSQSIAPQTWTYEFAPPVPQFTSEAPSMNFTIPYPVPRPGPVFGQVSVLVIAVEFTDYNHTLTLEEVANNTITQLDAYYKQVSYGLMSVTGRVVGWVRMPSKMSHYGWDNGPLIDDVDGDGYPDSWQLYKQALPTVAKEVDLTAYQQVLIVHAGYGEESSKAPNDIWSVTFMRWPMAIEGALERFAVVPEFQARGLSTIGVSTHEFGHLLGLPDLYSYTSEQVGPWDVMARGAWNGQPAGSSPAEMTAWSRIFLGWLTPEQFLNITIPTRINATLSPIEHPSSGLQAIRIQTPSQDSKHYYLVEVRQKVGYDTALPSSGVLITYIDETKSTPIKVIDAAQKTTTLNDAPFQAGQTYTDTQSNLVVSVSWTDGSSFSVIVDTMSPSPDIAIEGLSISSPTVHQNDTVSVDVTITNVGTLKSKSFGVILYLNDTVFASRTMSLNPGSSQVIHSTWTPTEPGLYVFKAVADSDRKISELSEDNNVKTVTLIVGYTLSLEVRPPGAGADLQWWLVVNGVNQTFTGTGQFQIGIFPGTNTLQIAPSIYLNPSSRYIFKQWGDNSTENPRTIDVAGDLILSVDFTLQYLLSLDPNSGTASSSGWYEYGSVVLVSATTPCNVISNQSRFVFMSWSGDVQSESSSVIINMTRPYSLVANWKTQYYLRVESPWTVGEGWYDANSETTVSLSSPVTIGKGTRQVFVQWSGDLSGVQTSEPIIMSGPKLVSAVWSTQYELVIQSEYGHTNGAGWYVPGTPAGFAVDTPIVEITDGTRVVFRGWSGDFQGNTTSGSIVMDAPKSLQSNWATQHLVAFGTQGAPSGTSLTITANDQPYRTTVPQNITLWLDAGSPISFSANQTITQDFKRFVLQEWRNSTGAPVKSPQSVSGPETYIATYKQLSMFPCIIATVTFGSELSPEVQFLRAFRDRLVLSTQAGSAFMSVFNIWYYSFSPQVADYIAGHDSSRDPVRFLLYPLIGILETAAVTFSLASFSPEFAIVLAGIVASTLIGLTYLTPMVLVAQRLAKRRLSSAVVVRAVSVCFLTVSLALVVGELTNSFWMLALSSSALVLVAMISTALAASCVLTAAWRRAEFLVRRRIASSVLAK